MHELPRFNTRFLQSMSSSSCSFGSTGASPSMPSFPSSLPKKRKIELDDTPPSSTLFISNMIDVVDETELRQALASVDGCVLMEMSVARKNGRAFCFAEYNSVESATTAMRRLKGFQLRTSPSPTGIFIQYSKSPFRRTPQGPAPNPFVASMSSYPHDRDSHSHTSSSSSSSSSSSRDRDSTSSRRDRDKDRDRDRVHR